MSARRPPTPSSPEGGRLFGLPRRPAEIQLAKLQGPRPNQVFQPLPSPTGKRPYQLKLEAVIGSAAVEEIKRGGELGFHCLGDTGGVKSPESQQIVSYWMEEDVRGGGAAAPSFLYHLGDVVYFNGQRTEYYGQFYEPYAEYRVPIVAIPGNHDGDPLDASVEPSLAAFVENFCASSPQLRPEAQEVERDTMTQPNVYWTLIAPFLTIVGLYTNVPEGGRLEQDQIEWLQAELRRARKRAALIVALHHPPYSADAHHGGSADMGQILDAAMNAAGRIPDLILTGHVHNYQRFTRSLEGRQVPYLVAGAGGYWHLHYMARDSEGKALPKPWQTPDPEVTLENYVEDRHGYLRFRVGPSALQAEYVTVPRPHESWRGGPVETADSFTLDLKKHQLS